MTQTATFDGASPSPGRPARRGPVPVSLWLPAAAVAAAMLLPLGYLVMRVAGGGVSLALLVDPQTLRVLANTCALALLVPLCAAAIAVPLAFLTARTDLPGRRVWTVLTALPLVVPTYVGGFAYVAAFGPRGMLQGLLAPLGVQRLPEIYGLPGAVLTLTVFCYPYLLLTVRGALRGLDPALEEAARGLGRSAAETWWRVTLPQLRPAIGGGSLLVALYALSDFGAVSLLRFDTLTRAIYLQYQGAFDRTPAAALALVLVAFAVALLVAESRWRGRAAYHRSTPGSRSQTRLLPLGRWRLPALAFCALVVVLALVVPLAVMGFWLARGLRASEPVRLAAGAAWNSLRVSGIAAVVTAAAALPVALLGVRYRSRWTILLERGTYLGYALPGIVVALALVFFGARYAGPLYQTLGLLVVAYAVRFLPQAVGAIRPSALQLSPSLEEAARGLGAGSVRVLRSVTVPLIRPGVAAAVALVFLTTMKELPATLLLAPTGFTTLATAVWNATSEAFFARAAAPALLLVLLSGVPLAFLLTPQAANGASHPAALLAPGPETPLAAVPGTAEQVPLRGGVG